MKPSEDSKIFFIGMILGAILCAFFASKASSKPIDIQKINKQEGFSGEAEASYEHKSGIENKTELSGEVFFQHKEKSDTFAVAIETELEEKDGKNNTKNLGHLRYRRTSVGDYGIEGFLQREEDSTRSITSSKVAALGTYWKPLNNYPYVLILGTAIVVEIEEYQSKQEEYANRSYTYVSFGFKLDKSVSIAETFHVEPKIGEANDSRWFNNLNLKVKSASNVTIGLEMNSSFDSHPPTGPSQETHVIKTTIGVEF